MSVLTESTKEGNKKLLDFKSKQELFAEKRLIVRVKVKRPHYLMKVKRPHYLMTARSKSWYSRARKKPKKFSRNTR